MNSIKKKLILFTLILVVLIVGINIFISIKNARYNEYESDTINNINAKALQIDNNKITSLSERSSDYIAYMTKIKNTSDLNLSQIEVYYNDLDKNDKVISNSKIDIDVTLSPKEVMQLQIVPKDYAYSVEITGYKYIVGDCSVVVDLKDNDIKISENKKYLENSRSYDVMSISKVDKGKTRKDDLHFTMEIENISDKNLGNIVLKIAEIDKNKEIVSIDHIIYNSILKPQQKGEIVNSLQNSDYDIKILGYTYDDIENKSNIDVDLITKKVNITEN